MIDLYCERTVTGLWGEPLNTLSNIAFFIAAWTIWRQARRNGRVDASLGLLLVLLLAIGTGSTLFHMFANAWSEWLDVIPITLFQLAFITLYLRRVAGLSLLPLSALLAIFLSASIAASHYPQLINGSAGYLPSLLFLSGMGLYHYRSRKNGPWLLLGAAALFLVSLILRSIDNAVCAALPMGTHLFWHLFNGGVLYLTLRAYMDNTRRFHHGEQV